ANALIEAQIEDAEGNTDQAIATLTKLLDKDAKQGNAYALLVSLWTKKKDLAKALQCSETWAEKIPDDLAAATNLVARLAKEKKLDAAHKKADRFTQSTIKEVARRFDERKVIDEKDTDAKKKALLDEVRWQLDLRFAQAFLQGENPKEAESRLNQLLKSKP